MERGSRGWWEHPSKPPAWGRGEGDGGSRRGPEGPGGSCSWCGHSLLAPPSSPPPLQMCVALVMQLVQGAADMPPVDAGAKAAHQKCGAPHHWADRFWAGLMDK